ncbi:hypothetical protein B0T20DRAFT_486174, partial [Sordaria brevicollis]
AIVATTHVAPTFHTLFSQLTSLLFCAITGKSMTVTAVCFQFHPSHHDSRMLYPLISSHTRPGSHVCSRETAQTGWKLSRLFSGSAPRRVGSFHLPCGEPVADCSKRLAWPTTRVAVCLPRRPTSSVIIVVEGSSQLPTPSSNTKSAHILRRFFTSSPFHSSHSVYSSLSLHDLVTVKLLTLRPSSGRIRRRHRHSIHLS